MQTKYGFKTDVLLLFLTAALEDGNGVPESGHVLLQVLLTPVFVFRSQAPMPLTMKVQSARLQRELELQGSNHDSYMHTLAPDTIHNVTFTYKYVASWRFMFVCTYPVTFVLSFPLYVL